MSQQSHQFTIVWFENTNQYNCNFTHCFPYHSVKTFPDIVLMNWMQKKLLNWEGKVKNPVKSIRYIFTPVGKWIFSWHPKSEKWVLPRTSSYISIGRVPKGQEYFGTVWTSPWQNHFSDFGCQEKAFSEITVLNSKMLKMQILCCQKTREINAIQMDTTRR